MAWIELHQSLFTHRKTIEAAALLNVPEVYLVGHLTALWTWALDNAPDGMLRLPVFVIERACQWVGEQGALLSTLAQVGFVDSLPDGGYHIHDWHAYAGRLMEQRSKNAARMRRSRAQKARPEKAPEADPRPACAARAPATVPNPTVPDRTVPNQEEESTPALHALYKAYRLQRHPDSPSSLWPPAEWNKALPWLTLLQGSGATPESVTQATQAAITRWKHSGQVTVKAIAEHWSELLEPERRSASAAASSSPSPRQSASERRAAEWHQRTRRELDRQLAAFDDWAESRQDHSPHDGERPAMGVVRPPCPAARSSPSLAEGDGLQGHIAGRSPSRARQIPMRPLAELSRRMA